MAAEPGRARSRVSSRGRRVAGTRPFVAPADSAPITPTHTSRIRRHPSRARRGTLVDMRLFVGRRTDDSLCADASGSCVWSCFTNSTSAFADVDQTDAWKNGAADAAARIEAGGIDAIERMPVHPRHAKRLPRTLYDASDDGCGAPRARSASRTRCATPTPTRPSGRAFATTPSSVVGMRSEETRFATHREFAEAQMPNLSIVDLAAGHGVNMEDAHGFNQALIDFISGHRH